MAEPGDQTRAGSQIRMLTGVLRMFHVWSLKIPGRPASSFLIVLTGIWVVPRDRDFPGKRLQLRQGVRPSQLSMLANPGSAIRIRPKQVEGEAMAQPESAIEYLAS